MPGGEELQEHQVHKSDNKQSSHCSVTANTTEVRSLPQTRPSRGAHRVATNGDDAQPHQALQPPDSHRRALNRPGSSPGPNAPGSTLTRHEPWPLTAIGATFVRQPHDKAGARENRRLAAARRPERSSAATPCALSLESAEAVVNERGRQPSGGRSIGFSQRRATARAPVSHSAIPSRLPKSCSSSWSRSAFRSCHRLLGPRRGSDR
jgi:hypothetical protein